MTLRRMFFMSATARLLCFDFCCVRPGKRNELSMVLTLYDLKQPSPFESVNLSESSLNCEGTLNHDQPRYGVRGVPMIRSQSQ